MPDKNLTIGLGFSADTSKARQEIDKLKNQLNNLAITTKVSDSFGDLDKSIDNSIDKVIKLRSELEKATNSNGTLNLSKLSAV